MGSHGKIISFSIITTIHILNKVKWLYFLPKKLVSNLIVYDTLNTHTYKAPNK